MFITSQPFHQKRNFKFSSHLAGTTFNNRRFLSSCSYLDSDIKLSTAASDDDPRAKLTILFEQMQHAGQGDPRQQLHTANRSKEVRSAAEKITDREYKSSIQPSNRKFSVASGRKDGKQVYLPSEKMETRRTSILDTALTMVHQVLNAKKPTRRKSLKRKLAFNPNVDVFYSPFVHIRIIDRIKNLAELEEKSLKLNFEKIYKKLIKTQLMGEFTANFMQTIERYIREIIQNGEMYDNPFGVELDPELKTISRKEEFLEKLIEFWGACEERKIRELVKYYCIPSQEASDKILAELLEELVIQIYEKKCCNRDKQYAIMTVEGEQITHVSQIYFSTQELLLVPAVDLERHYQAYRHLIEEHDKSLKMTLRQSIKHSFVQRIVHQQIDESRGNYQHDPHAFNDSRRELVERATLVVHSKSKLRLHPKKERAGEGRFDDLFQRRSSRNDNLFTNYILRKEREKKEYVLILERLRALLDPGHVYEVRSRLDESTEEEFRKLHLFNDKYDITYNHSPLNARRMFLINMIENCPVFASRTTEQVEKILSMIETVYGMGLDNINEIDYAQFKEIYETAHGVSHKDVITKFVLAYLSFDDFGEMQKGEFFQMLDLCFAHAPRPQRLIKENIWGLLESMELVENGALRRQNLAIWYEPVKVVYMLLLSVIFGREYESLDEMARDLLKYYHD